MSNSNPQNPKPTHSSLPKINTVSRANTTPHKHPHLHRKYHRHHHARDTIQSAVQLQHPFSFDAYNPLKRSHGSNKSPDSSRRGSLKPGAEGQQQEAPEPEQEAAKPERVITKEDEELQEALNALARDAHQATRNLDDTYYSLLEKLAALRSTLSSLQKLSASAETARSEFGRDAEGLADELERSTRGFAGFEAQGRSVDELERSKGLEERLERCRESVEEWETREREERKRKNRRDWFVWSMVAAALVLLVAFAVWRKSAQVRLGVAGVGVVS
ncbi:hypothetical protein H2203_005819 [Taxawa tesnikishii (nom. ined.)]|nr:hypothetical protein H2203_005819 [Dothideales sp. JES 119]